MTPHMEDTVTMAPRCRRTKAGDRRPQGVEHPVQIHPHHLAPLLVRGVGKQLLGQGDPCVAHQGVQGAQLFLRRPDQSGRLGRVRHIAGQEGGLSPGGGDLCCQASARPREVR